MKKEKKESGTKLSFKAAFEAALKDKLQNMPQMLVADDLRDEMKVRRQNIKPAGIWNEEAVIGFNLGVDSVYQLLFSLLEVPPAEWEKVK